MAIDYGISSLDTGALDIKYTGDEGPKSPKQIAGGEYNRVLELIEKVREGGPLSEEEKIELQQLIQTLTAKGINVEELIGEKLTGDTRTASADPMLQDEYDKYVFELQEMHPEAVPMSIEQFKQQAVSSMANGGIMRLGYKHGGIMGSNAGKSDLRLVRNNKIKGNARVSFNLSLDKFKTDISKLPTSQNLVYATQLLLNEFNAEQNHYAQIDNTLVFDAETYAYNSMYQKIASAGHKFVNKYDGVEYLNFQTIYQELRQNKDYGEFIGGWVKKSGISKIPEKYRTELIKWADKGMKDQKDFFINQKTRLNDVNGDPISKLIGDWINDDLKPKDAAGNDIQPRTFLESMIQKAESTHKITPEFAKSLYNRIEGIVTDKSKGAKTDSFGSPASLNKYIDKILTNQWTVRDTLNVQNDPTIEYKGKKFLMDFLKTWSTELDETKKMYLEEYIATFENKITGVTGKITDVMGLQLLEKQKFNATKAIRAIVAEGERAGISYYEMFENPNSDFYIPKRLDSIYNISISNLGQIQTEVATNKNFWASKYNESLSYYVDADIDTPGQQVYEKFDMKEIVDEKGVVIGQEKVPIGKVAIYYERYLNKPQPPNQYRIVEGKKIQIPIGEYENSKEYLKYIKDYAIWLSKGNFNTMKIPSIYKSILGYTDLADKEKLENQ